MKKWLCAIGAFLLSMVCVRPVYADVINEPRDSFYERHAEECEYVNRAFTANGPDGKVIFYANPESAKVTATWENGNTAWITFTYQDGDGISWGVVENTGWVPMDYMVVVYDSISFAEEYAEVIESERGTLDKQYAKEELYLWEYPASSEGYSMDSEFTKEYLPEYTGVYVDEAGRRWGNVNYYYGLKNVWICIDAPTADLEELYPDGNVPQRGEALEESPEMQDTSVEQSTERIVPRTNHRVVLLAVALVLLVVVITAVLLVVLKRRSRNR